MGEDTGQNDRQTDRQTDTLTDNKGRLELSGAREPITVVHLHSKCCCTCVVCDDYILATESATRTCVHTVTQT